MDDADRAEEVIERTRQEGIKRAAKPMEKGEPGECELCGEQSKRLVHGVCASCRDRYHLN
jgi:hypothetical protein